MFPLSSSSKIHPTSLPMQLYVPLSFKYKKQKQTKKQTDTNQKYAKQKSKQTGKRPVRRNQSKMKQKYFAFFFVLATPEYGACPGVWLIYTVRLQWRRQIFPLPVSVTAPCKGWEPMSTSPSQCWDPICFESV